MGLKLVMGSSTVYFLFLFFLLCVCVRSHLLAQNNPHQKTKMRLKWIDDNIAKICVQKVYMLLFLASPFSILANPPIFFSECFIFFPHYYKKNEIYIWACYSWFSFYSISGKVSDDKNDSVEFVFSSCLFEWNLFLYIFFWAATFASNVNTFKIKVKKRDSEMNGVH